MSELPIKATLKAGGGYDAPWVTVDAADPTDLDMKMKALIAGDALASVVTAANTLKAVNALPDGSTPVQAPPAQVPASAPGWAQPAQQAAPPQQNNGVRYHPEGKLCGACGSAVFYKESRNGQYKFWTCPNQRSKGDGHHSEFIN